MSNAQNVQGHIRRATRVPRVPRAKLAATRPASTLRPLAPLQASRHEPPRVHFPHMQPVPNLYPRYEAPATGEKRNPLPRYLFRPQHPVLPQHPALVPPPKR